MSLQGLGPRASPVRLGKRLRSAKSSDFSSDDDDDVSKTGDSPFTGSSPLKDPLKHGLSSMESIAAADSSDDEH